MNVAPTQSSSYLLDVKIKWDQLSDTKILKKGSSSKSAVVEIFIFFFPSHAELL